MSSFICYRTSQYKLHYFETPTNIKFVMLTDTKAPSMRIALQQIYVNLYVEYGRWQVEQAKRGPGIKRVYDTDSSISRQVVKNPLSPVEHPGGVGVNNELFEESLELFVVCMMMPGPASGETV